MLTNGALLESVTEQYYYKESENFSVNIYGML